MSLTTYALQRAQLLFRISFLSLVTTRLSSHSFPQLHSALNSEFNSEAEMLGFVPIIGQVLEDSFRADSRSSLFPVLRTGAEAFSGTQYRTGPAHFHPCLLVRHHIVAIVFKTYFDLRKWVTQ
ncbi:hypothetical protein AMECASPLE_004195 [Ameca splendens]|uniref:Secreted protein n=1 Tax=Ameca splendens TaxID=208324 RepID=A0ABV0ZJM8_9TELE